MFQNPTVRLGLSLKTPDYVHWAFGCIGCPLHCIWETPFKIDDDKEKTEGKYRQGFQVYGDPGSSLSLGLSFSWTPGHAEKINWEFYDCLFD